jgi:hypothetical protein
VLGDTEVHVTLYGGGAMLATFAFDVCHDVYRAARDVIDAKIPTLNAENSGKYQWRPDRMPRLAEYVCDFARAGERALGGARGGDFDASSSGPILGESRQAEACSTAHRASPSQKPFRASRMAMFRVFYLGGAEYQAARRHLGISELTWADWSDEIRRRVGRELTSAGVFPPSRYFREESARAS